MKKHLPFLSLIVVVLLFFSCGKELEFNKPAASTSTIIPTTTLAGTGLQGYTNGTGTAASFNNPTCLVVDTAGNVYVADYRNNAIRKITSAGVVTTLAGGGTPGVVDSTGVTGVFNRPAGVAIDAAGNVYVADGGNNMIRMINPAGTISILAGTGASGAVNGAAATATFNSPQGIALDAAGNVYVADNGNNQVRKISKAGMVTVMAGSDTSGSANGSDTSARFNEPTALTLDAAGNVYVADYGNNLIRKITPAGLVTTFAGSGAAGAANGTGPAASFNGPAGIAIDVAGNIYVADYSNNLIRKITPAGAVTSISNAALNRPYGVAVDAAGNIYVANYGNSTIQKIGK
jgi:serine/threonine-protein kinase